MIRTFVECETFFLSLKWGLKKTWNEKRKLYNTTTSERHSRKKMDIFRNIGRFSHCTIFCTLGPIFNFCWVQEIELHIWALCHSRTFFLKYVKNLPKIWPFQMNKSYVIWKSYILGMARSQWAIKWKTSEYSKNQH